MLQIYNIYTIDQKCSWTYIYVNKNIDDCYVEMVFYNFLIIILFCFKKNAKFARYLVNLYSVEIIKFFNYVLV